MVKTLSIDEYYMKLALQLATTMRGITSPDPTVGAVIVKNNRIIATGFHGKHKSPHAEAYALTRAGKAAQGATLYVTLEPCCHFGNNPPCTEQIIQAGITRVVYAINDPNPLVKACNSIHSLQKNKIEVITNICSDSATKINEVYLKTILSPYPFIHLKVASTLDGKTATASGESKWITGEQARAYTHNLRYHYDAIMVGAITITHDNPQLTVRNPWPAIHPKRHKQPLRIILDPHESVPANAIVLQDPTAPTLLIRATPVSETFANALGNHVEVINFPLDEQGETAEKNEKTGFNLSKLMMALRQRGIASILVESGGNLSAALLNEELIDKISFIFAPKLIGNNGLNSIGLLKTSTLAQAIHLTSITSFLIGEDVVIEGRLRAHLV